MSKIDANSIRVGNILNYEGKLCQVTKTQHTQPGKGGAYMQVEMKDIVAGTKFNERFRSSETVERASLEQRDFQFMYESDDMLELMDTSTYEQVAVPKSMAGEHIDFMQEGTMLIVEFYQDTPLSVRCKENLQVFEVTECEPVVKGQTAASSNKPAVLANGVRIMVPPFINIGDKVVVNADTREYVERAK
jgi:elongation factor P